MKARTDIKKTMTRTICAAAAAMLLCTSCGNIDDPTKPAGGTEAPAGSQSSSAADYSDSKAEPESKAEPVQISAEPVTGSAGGEAGSTEMKLEAPSRDTLKAFAGFSGGLLSADCKGDIEEGKNVLISPESLLLALGMTANGAGGKTSEEMQSVLAGGADVDTMNSALYYISHHVGDSEGVTFSCANSLWTKAAPDFRAKGDFADSMRQIYGAEYFNVPFNDQTKDDINGWVSNHTNGMIPQIIDSMDSNAAAYLINAIAFEAEWDEQYIEDKVSEDASFTNSKGETEKCTMLYSEEGRYFTDGSAQAFIKPYKGGSYAFMGILPNEGISVSDYVSGLDGEGWYKLWDSMSYDTVDVVMPEFKCDYASEMSSGLISMGMGLPFDTGADFTKMAEYDHDYFFIKRVLHNTHIEVDRKGTKAAAATAVEMVTEDAVLIEESKFILLNRPFVYAIVDTETGFPVFLGAVNTVKG